MGCKGSKLDEQEAVVLCRGQADLLAVAVWHRYALADAHTALADSLMSVSSSLYLLLVSTPLRLTLPAERKDISPPPTCSSSPPHCSSHIDFPPSSASESGSLASLPPRCIVGHQEQLHRQHPHAVPCPHYGYGYGYGPEPPFGYPPGSLQLYYAQSRPPPIRPPSLSSSAASSERVYFGSFEPGVGNRFVCSAARHRAGQTGNRFDPSPGFFFHVITYRYLIVIDDVWTIAAWDVIQSKLPENNCSSRIIVTTRMETVAKACSDPSVYKYYMYQIKPLGLDDSKKLFLSRAFGSKDAPYPKELEDTMGNILKKCGGLPLAIISIASLLASYNSSESKDMWETIYKSIGYQMDNYPTLEGMRQILTLSYNHLPHHLKSCMMYLSLFPEDYLINKDRLLYRWIAEGLIEEKRGLTLMEVAEAYYDELVSRSMIEPAGDIISHIYGTVETCRVHDMMLEVMVSKSLEANFVSLIGGQYEGMSYERIRRLSIHGLVQGSEDLPSNKRKMAAGRGMSNDFNVQHVRSLSMFELEGHKLLDRLGEFNLLRVLDLEDCRGIQNKHMDYICRMYLLRYLCLRGTDISVIPPKVGELEHLQTLDVRATNLDRLPDTVQKLQKLERLLFSKKGVWSTMWMPPQGLWKMKALREVGWVVIKDDAQVAREISELENLQRFGFYVDCDDGPNGQKVLKELSLSLGKTYSLRFLDTGAIRTGRRTMNFLLDLPSPPRLLRFLRIGGGIDKLPNWVGSLTYLVEFHLSRTYLVDDQLFGVLCKLPNLKTIWLQQNSYTGQELVARATFIFPVLRNMDMTSESKCPEVFRFEEGSMKSLEKLSLTFGGHREKRIDGINNLTSLKEVQLRGRKGNSALNRALEQLKVENQSRAGPNKFKVAVKYQ